MLHRDTLRAANESPEDSLIADVKLRIQSRAVQVLKRFAIAFLKPKIKGVDRTEFERQLVDLIKEEVSSALDEASK